MKKGFVIILLTFFVILLVFSGIKKYGGDKASGENTASGTTQEDKSITPGDSEATESLGNEAGTFPDKDLFPRVNCPGMIGKENHEIIFHEGFALCYREPFEQAEWVAYVITEDKLEKNAERTDDFREDLDVSTESASPGDYKYTGYDRGHLAPAADMAYSTETMSQSFLMSNMSPQAPGFNRGIWKKLEAQVRAWAEEYNPLYVVTGPVLEEKAYPVIGENQVAVPEYFYKVLYAPESPGRKAVMAAFIIPNEGQKAPVSSFMVTVDEVEEITGLDFFWDLDDGLENSLESELCVNFWF